MMALWLGALACPAVAQDDRQDPLEDLGDTLRNLMEQLEPALEDIWEMLRGFGVIDDLRHYHPPEVLPNGDIIMRRRDDAPPYEPPEPGADDDPGIRT